MKWQKRARIGVAVFGIGVAITVYATIGERQNAVPVVRTSGLDPDAILESVGAEFQRFSEARQDYVIEADQLLTYEDGTTKFVGVTINISQRAGRDLVISGNEAQADSGQEEFHVTGNVRLASGDEFVVTAHQATLREVNATIRMEGPVSFERGRMSGFGVGMTYDHGTDVLSLSEQARVTVTDEAGVPVAEFNSDAATLASLEGYLTLDGNVHVVRGEQVLEADRSTAFLSEANDFTSIELRGNAKVVGGDAFDSMAAEEIDLSLSLLELRGDASVVGGQTFDSMTGGYIRLDLNEDGTGLEQLALANDAAIVMSGNDGESGREFAGNELDLTFAPDGSLTRVAGLGNVRVVLPGARGEPGRSVTAQAFEATGNAGMDLTWARFDDEVEYREEASKGRAPRVVHSSLLRITLADVAVTSALFGGGVRFEEQGFQASGAQAQYDPINGTLQLSGTDTGGAPHVADEQIEIDSDVIDITLVGRQITASGSVTTLLYAGGSERLPGLLEAGEPVNVSSDTLDYQGRGGAAVYTGDATLWQGATAIRADQIMLDRTSADLVASGTARSRIVFDLGEAVGRAAEIRYDDVARTITYETPAWTPAVVAPTPFEAVIEAVADGLMAEAVNLCADLTELGCDDLLVRPAQLSGPQGDIRARRIEVVLGRTTTSAERLEAYGDVSANLGMRTATGDRLTYFAEDERYVMSGIATIPVTIVEECRQTSGRAMTFFKSTKRIIVDGQEEVRTKSVRGASCVATPTP